MYVRLRMDETWLKGKTTGIRHAIKGIFIPDQEDGADPITRYLVLTLIAALLIAAASYWVYNRTHMFDDYTLLSSSELKDVEGTQYVMLSGRIIKYSHDGVFCVSTSNEMLWSAAYSIQTPICDASGGMMVIAEQQGDQVYVINSKGVVGNFKTSLPIMKARISENGVVALVQDDADEVTWVNLFDRNGTPLVSVKATQDETGYPLDVALTANAKQMMVSFMCTDNGQVTGRICTYDFSSAGDSDESHLVGSKDYPDRLFPVVFYGASNAPVAIADNGFVVFSSGRSLKERTQVSLPEEITSVFHDRKTIGFIFRSSMTDAKYRMEVYNLKGKNTMTSEFDFQYSDVRMDGGEVLLYDASNLNIYRTSGMQKLHVTYDQEVKYCTGISGLRKYMIITGDSIDRIRLK